MGEKTEIIKVTGGVEGKEYIRENKNIVLATTGFTGIQANLFYRSLSKCELEPKDIKNDKIYGFEFHRSEIPRINKVETLKKELKKLQDIAIESNTETNWSRIKPFPKIGEYQDGLIQIWFLGEFLKPILELKKETGWATMLLAEIFSLNGAYPKKLYSIFSSVKNLNNTRLEYEIEVLKKILNVVDKYKHNPSMFMKMVIYPAIKQINEKTSIHVKTIYKSKRGLKAGMVIFDVSKKSKLEIKKQNESSPEAEPVEPNELKMKQYFDNAFNDDRHYRCYMHLKDLGFLPQQAYNCANKLETMKLFFKWKHDNQIDADLKSGNITKAEAKTRFFSELKTNKYRI